jgi:DNA-binding NtrC family response regulator
LPDDRRPTGEARNAHILVVDDEPLIAGLIADALTTEGYEVDMAANGREALEKIAAQSFDLIVSDLRMPEVDGVALYHELERRRPNLLARFVFVSGTTDLLEYTQFLADTRIPVLGKPFHLEVLRRLIEQSLGVHR